MKKKKKNYKIRSKVYKFMGNSIIAITTIFGFVAYELSIDFENFRTELENFIVINPNNVKLNMIIAFPLLISILVFIWVYRKKNQEELKNKVSFPLLFITILLWLIYSVIEVTLCATLGAFIGSIFDEIIFSPLSNSAKSKYLDEHSIDLEFRKEKVRKRVRDETDGTV